MIVLTLLTKRYFLPFFLTQFLGAFNDNFFKSALLLWFTFHVSEDYMIKASLLVTLAGALFILPFFLFSTYAGLLSDKYNKVIICRYSKMAEVAVMILGTLCFQSGNILGLLGVIFLMGTQSSFFGPVKYSLLPTYLSKDKLIYGNSFIEASTFLAILLGTIFGGIIIMMPNGAEWVGIIAIVIALSGWWSSVFMPDIPHEKQEIAITHHIIKNTKTIISYCKNSSHLWFHIIAISWFWVFGATFLTQLPTLTVQAYNGDATIVTFFLATFSIGIAIGSFICSKFFQHYAYQLSIVGLLGMLCTGIVFIGTSYSYMDMMSMADEKLMTYQDFFYVSYEHGFVIAVSFVTMAIFAGIYVVPLYTTIQLTTSYEFLSRVIACINIMNALFMVVGALIVMVLLAWEWSMINIMLMTIIGNAIMLLLFRKHKA